MRKTFKYRLRPSKHQRTKFIQTLEFCRWVYNETLATRKNAWEQERNSLSLYDTNKLLTIWKGERSELKGVFSQVLQNAQERVDLAFKSFFRRVKAGEKPGYPRFRNYGWYESFTYKQFGFELLETVCSFLKSVQSRSFFIVPSKARSKRSLSDEIGSAIGTHASHARLNPNLCLSKTGPSE